MPPTLLLDLDGTLSDPLAGIGRSINYALESHGFPTKPLAELATCIGPPLEESFHALTGEREDSLIRALIAKYRERYGEIGYAENEVYPGIPEALSALEAAGVRMGVCTSKRADFAERILLRFELRERFAFVSGGDVGIRKGMQIRDLLESRKVGFDAVMVGDRGVDLIAARENGLKGVGVLWGFGSRRELESEQPYLILANPTELASLADQEN